MAKKSKCCNEQIRIEGDNKEGTHYYVCTKCDQPCDIARPVTKEEKRFHYGFRFYSRQAEGKGKMVAFINEDSLDRWLQAEDLKNIPALGGGKRISCSYDELRKYCSHMTDQEFEDELQYLIME